ncbi:uncharacterized protein CTHT_0036580 [Thermochaetoides thermophila DSM 1495]|uniref:Uncharacterized protein n=1 Tax=Chaetomium thermophilum (strain DSM 1495 / CBS 144.50 / IMI 039719) TaxID=759272 RepID=G0S7E6_CHATD|nr:hypothetical protein CTHT_0036580 [Thermochaetoides thermophila DSM 1495]EGS21790.1 hypothetical protein CTHT_0036580 [Thermochaetoides thermophila DSM 1495]
MTQSSPPSLKLEPPLLYSDHTLDCRRLARQVRNFMKDPLPDISLPLEPYDVEQGQGLEFPRALVEADKEQTKSVENEKLNVTRDILWYISQTIKSDWTEENQQQLYESAAGYPGLWARRPMTPPLSPMFEQFEQYFVPDDDTCQIPVPSDPSSRLSQEIEGAEARILIPDAEFWAQALENDVFKECEDDIDISKMIKNGELSVSLEVSSPLVASRDMKIDVPLLPSYDDANASTAIPLLDSSELAPATALITSGDITSESEGPTGQLVKLFLESEEKMTRGAEQEKPQPLDPTVRVTVPVMDFSIPASEWELNLWNAITVFRWIRENTPVDWQGVKWTYSRAAEQRMVWAPIAHLKEMKPLEEKIDEDPRLLGDFFSPIPDDDIPHSEDYVYKTPGLAIFQVNEYDDDQDDYLTLQNSPKKPQSTLFALDDQPLSLSSPANTSYHCAFNDWHNSPDLMVLLDIKQRQISEKIQKKQPTKRLRAEEENQTDTDAFSSELIPSTNVLKGVMAEYTDFSSLVDNFLDMNFPKRPKLTHSSYFQKQDTFKKAQPTFNSSPQTSASASTPTPALAPTVVLPDTPPRVVVSSTVSMMVLNHLKQDRCPSIKEQTAW